MTVFSSCFR